MADQRDRSWREFVAGPEADVVPQARRFVRSVADGLPDDVVADLELVTSELVGNASLHGEPPVVVRVRRTDESVRLEVEDAGRNLPVQVRQRSDAMTGRGLSLVGALAEGWGVSAGRPGKVVWAELSTAAGHRPAPAMLEMDRDSILASWPDLDDADVPRYTVRLGAVPTELLLSAKAHIDNVVREMSLMRAGSGQSTRTLAPAVARLIETVTSDFADARAEIKRQALDSAAKGLAMTDLELHLPVEAAAAGERYLKALDDADRYARASRLLTLAAPESHRVFRRWYVESLIEQLRAAARGDQPAEARPFAEVLAETVDRLYAALAGDDEA